MINTLKTTINGEQVQLPLEQFKKLVSNYEILKKENAKLSEANDYLNNEIKRYNTEFTSDNKK